MSSWSASVIASSMGFAVSEWSTAVTSRRRTFDRAQGGERSDILAASDREFALRRHLPNRATGAIIDGTTPFVQLGGRRFDTLSLPALPTGTERYLEGPFTAWMLES